VRSRDELRSFFASTRAAMGRTWKEVRALLRSRARAHSAPELVADLLSNLLWGTAIALLLFVLRDSPNLQRLDDLTVDWVMGSLGSAERQVIADRFVWFDIDDKTYETWNEPPFTPRDKIQRLIWYAAESGAELVIVDIDLSHRRQREEIDTTPTRIRRLGVPATIPDDEINNYDNYEDQKLYDYLEAYPGDCTAGDHCPPIILGRPFRNDLPKPSFLDPAIAHSTRVFWASAQFEPDSDMVIRRWRLWEPLCENGRAGAIPSIELVVEALVNPERPQAMAEDPKAAYDFLVQSLSGTTVCSGGTPQMSGQAPADGTPNRVRIRHIIEDQTANQKDNLVHRIVYAMPWHQDDTAIARPAMYILNAPITSHAAFSGKIVMIGGSAQDTGDIHPTPLGPMPGAFALINAITSLEQHGEITHAPGWVDLLVEIALIAIMSFSFLFLRSFLGMIVSTVVILCVLVPICLKLFAHGLWLDFSIPLIAVQLHELVDRIKDSLE
jgi:CHASE2 domain-containing sensor protein